MNAMTHKGYAARVEFDAEDHIFVGRVIGIRDVICFIWRDGTAERVEICDYH
jgi:predicted HicB family RNase H-like nuclease